MQLLATASQGALFNIEANIGSVTDPEFVAMSSSGSMTRTRGSARRCAAGFETAGLIELFKQIAARFDLRPRTRRAAA